MAIDYDFIPQYNINVLSGKNFDRLFPKDNKKVMINHLLSDELEFADPQQAIGEKLIIGGDTLEITGVFENFHQMSVKTPIIPLACQLGESGSFYSIKLETANYKNTIEALENQWKTFFPGNPVDYFFLDQFFNRQYEKDNRFGEAFSFFTALAIFIASLGLIGLASFMTLQRTKEIGIRKVLGSNVSGIIVLLSKEFMLPVVLSILIACPLGWWIMNLWLQSFPYHTTINLWAFVVSGILVLLIAFLSVSSQTLKAAMTKPAETLKHE
jgi:putative ABC transport system permease protein